MVANMIEVIATIGSVLGVGVALGPDATSWWAGWVAPAIIISSVGLLLTVGTAVFVGGRSVGGVNSNLKSLNTSVGNVKVTLSDFMKEVRGKLDQIFERLPSPPAIIEGSPLRLTKLGRNIAEELEADAWAARLADGLKEQVQGMDAYEIQDHCFEYVEKHAYSDEERKRVRSVAYENGKPVDEIRRVLAIQLRDKLLALASLSPP